MGKVQVRVEKRTVEAPPPPDDGKVKAAVAKGRQIADDAEALSDEIDHVLAENAEALKDYRARGGE